MGISAELKQAWLATDDDQPNQNTEEYRREDPEQDIYEQVRKIIFEQRDEPRPEPFQAAFATMAAAIARVHPGREHAHWFAIFTENLIYKPLFGISAKQLRALYGLSRKASLSAVLPEEAKRMMIERMTFITTQLTTGKDYAEIKELMLSELASKPLLLELLPPPAKSTRQSSQGHLSHGISTPLPGQLSITR